MALSKVDPNFLNVSQIGGRRNMIINGAMQVSQRPDISSVTVSGGNYYDFHSTDRWKTGYANMDSLVFSCEQSTDAPDGLNFSRKYTIHTAKANAADQYFSAWTRLERHSYSGVGIGTSAAKNLTLSFWVKSSETGTFAGIHLVYPTAGNAYEINFTYTINTANTWEYKTVSLPTSSLTASTYYMQPSTDGGDYTAFHMNAGTDYDGGTGSTSSYKSYSGNDWAVGHQVDITTVTNATWAITGVQLEIGDTATPFEHRSYWDELQSCRRYYHSIGTAQAGAGYEILAHGFSDTTTRGIHPVHLPVQLRSSPTLKTSGDYTKFYWRSPIASPTSPTATGLPTIGQYGLNFVRFDCNADSMTVGYGCYFSQNGDATAYIAFDAEI